jgi:hypothetical protein
VQATGRVNDQDVDVPVVCRLHGIENHCTGVGARLVRDDWDIDAFTPDLQLIDRGGTECITGGKHHGSAEVLVVLGQLGDGGCLPGAIDAHHEDHERDATLENLDLPIAGGELEKLDHFQPKNFPGIRGIDDVLIADFLLELGNELLAYIPTDIGLDEEHFKVFEQFIVDFGSIEQPGDFEKHAATCLLEPLFKLDIGFGLSPKQFPEHWLSFRGNRVRLDA